LQCTVTQIILSSAQSTAEPAILQKPGQMSFHLYTYSFVCLPTARQHSELRTNILHDILSLFDSQHFTFDV